MDDPPQRPAQLARYAELAQVGMEMAAPIVLGLILDFQIGTVPWLTIAGAVLGLVGGIAHLIYVANRQLKDEGKQQDSP